MKTTRKSDSQIMQILSQAGSGVPVSELCREHCMSSATFYKWRVKYGGMDTSMITRLKELEAENSRLKKMARQAINDHRVTVRLACQAFKISETCYRYDPKLSSENELIADWLLRLTITHKQWGFGLCFMYLRNTKGFKWNHKRVYRVYKQLELNLRIKPRRRIKRDKPQALSVPLSINQTPVGRLEHSM